MKCSTLRRCRRSSRTLKEPLTYPSGSTGCRGSSVIHKPSSIETALARNACLYTGEHSRECLLFGDQLPGVGTKMGTLVGRAGVLAPRESGHRDRADLQEFLAVLRDTKAMTERWAASILRPR